MAQMYALRGTETGKVKIGITENFKTRLPSYRTHCPEPIEVLIVFEFGGVRGAAADFERYLLEIWKARITHGEWFTAPVEMLQGIINLDHMAGYGSGIRWTEEDHRQRDAIDVDWKVGPENTGQLWLGDQLVATFSHAIIAKRLAGSFRQILSEEYRLNPDGSGQTNERSIHSIGGDFVEARKA